MSYNNIQLMAATSHLSLLETYQFNNKIRLGRQKDGGYVIADLPAGYDCYVSAGVANEESFSRDFINKYGMNRGNSFAFDGTIKKYPRRFTKKITFIRKNINTFVDDYNVNLRRIIDHFQNIFLKMDIEGAEYTWLLSLSENDLKKFKQIAIEFHGLNHQEPQFGCTFEDKKKCWEKLAKTHYLIHAHANNNAGTVNGIPNVIELTYINKNCLTTEPALNTTKFPISGLDFPNNRKKPDVNLGIYPFIQL